MKSCLFNGWKWLLTALLLLACAHVSAESKLYGFKMVQQEHVMLHFDLNSADASAELFSLTDPHRLVIDLPDTTLATQLPNERFSDGVVQRIRYAQHGREFLRVVVDLRRAVSPTYQFVPRQGGQRLLIDLGVQGNPALVKPRHKVIEQLPLRDAVVAIDAGHGGRDPGALGQRKTQEKDITLAIALKLYQRLLDQPGIKPVLIRDSDVYVALRERMAIARRNKADLFVSIHADAVENKNEVKGSSVYTLSVDGATSEAAAWLAKSENESAALYGDVTLNGLDDSVQQTLLNLVQGSSMEKSMEAAADILDELKEIGNVHKRAVEQAGFAVLKAPDMPSVLVETAFISNRQEEKKLKSARYQHELAAAMERGIVRFLSRRAPEGTYLAAQRRRQG